MRKKINDIGLKTKFMLIFLIISLIMCGGNITVFLILQNAYNNELYDKSTQMMIILAEEIQSELDRVIYDSEKIISDEILQKSLSDMKNIDENKLEWLDAFQTVRNRINNFELYSPDICNVFLQSSSGQKFGRINTKGGFSEDSIKDLYQLAKEGNGKERWAYFPKIKNSIVLTREIREMKDLTLRELGTLIIRVDLKEIIDRCRRPLLNNDQMIQIAIYDGQNQIYSSDNVVGSINPDIEKFSIREVNAEKYFNIQYCLENMGWNCIMAIPYDAIFCRVTSAVQIAITIIVCVLIVSLVLCSKLTSSVVAHIESLIEQCDMFARGKYKPESQIYDKYALRQDEIGKLFRHFDRMAYENGKMIQETYIKQQLLLEAQVSNLRAQIRPHFIYNTLESINCLAHTVGEERIATMTSALGRMLRVSLKEQKHVVSVKEELDMVEEYLKIQSVRLGKRLKVYIEVDEYYYDIKIPSMTLQPLVENSIFYAAEEMDDDCEIRLFSREEDGKVKIVVEDNGAGMDEDILEKLEKKEKIPEGLGIGLLNINKRLKILIAEDCGLVVGREGNKTQVAVKLSKETV